MKGKKILVVDDNKVNIKVLEGTLTKAGYTVINAYSGSEAIELAQKELPDFILLDIKMPNVNGIQVGETLRGFPETQNIPICYITGLLSKEEERDLGGRIMGSFFIAKPYDPKVLLEEIAKRI